VFAYSPFIVSTNIYNKEKSN